MSNVSGSNAGTMPPRHGKKLAEVMDAAFKSNKEADVDAVETSEPSPRTETTEAPAAPSTAEPTASPPKPPPPRKIEGYTFQIDAVYPPQPCERCVRSKKTCKGIAGVRCENCKSLHQKCSNSTGPPRGRHAAANQLSASSNVENKAGPSTESTRAKRKASASKSKLIDDAEEGEENIDEKGEGSAPKKRRAGNDARANALKDVAELESAIKKLQTSISKDMTKLTQLSASLAAQIRALD